jgi:hypothetical protein
VDYLCALPVERSVVTRPFGRLMDRGSILDSHKSHFCLLHSVHAYSGAHPASYLVDTGNKADHSHLVSRLRINGAIPPLLHIR